MKNCLKLPCFAGRVLYYFIKTAALEVVVSIHWWDGGCGGRCHAHLQLQHQSNWGYNLAQKNVHWRNFRFLEGKAPGSCLSWTKVSQIPLLRCFSSQCCNVLLEMSGHATATFPCKKRNKTEACVSGSTNTWAFSKYPWSYGQKASPSPINC